MNHSPVVVRKTARSVRASESNDGGRCSMSNTPVAVAACTTAGSSGFTTSALTGTWPREKLGGGTKAPRGRPGLNTLNVNPPFMLLKMPSKDVPAYTVLGVTGSMAKALS